MRCLELIVRTFGRLAGWIAIGAACWPAAAQQSPIAREDQLRAGYLINFARFVEWPPGSGSDSRTFCFVGAEGIRTSIVSAVAAGGVNAISVRALSRGD